MKKRRSFINKQLLVVGFVCMLCLTACGMDKKSTSDNDVKDFCKQYASNYTVIESESDDYLVSVESPDFEKIVEIILESGQSELNAKILEETIENNPACKKEYFVNVENEDTTVIEEAFLEQVSYELVIAAIQDIKYEETWSVEE